MVPTVDGQQLPSTSEQLGSGAGSLDLRTGNWWGFGEGDSYHRYHIVIYVLDLELRSVSIFTKIYLYIDDIFFLNW